MLVARSLSRSLLSLLVMLIVAARVEAQSIPLPAESPRAGTNVTPAVKARSKQAWRPKGSVVPAQVEEPYVELTVELNGGAEPTLAPPLDEPAAEIQYLRAPANAVPIPTESEYEQDLDPRPAQPLPPRANPLRQARRPQNVAQRNPIQRAQNPVELEVDPEPIPRVISPRMLQDVPGPRSAPPREAWQVAPGQRYAPQQGGVSGSRSFEPRHDYPADVDNPTAGPREPYPNDQDQYPDEQVPGEELYGMPRVFETNAYGRFSGRGEPLTAGSWLNRPYYVGGFIGGLGGDTLVEDEIKANGGFFWGGNIGWDYDPYWGLEMRLAFSSQGLDYLTNYFIDNQYNDLILWDTSFIYYPWGDARWRPYFKLGFGFADFDYVDAIGFRRSEMVYEMPFGIGLKYRVNQYWVWRFDATDNLIFGGNAGMATQNQFSLACGLEYRFGGRRQSYWPWNPSRRWR
jgi:hypothetical protein